MGDAANHHPPCPSVSKLPVRPASGMLGANEETVVRFVVAEEVRPDMTAVRDFNFQKPQADLTAVAQEGPGLNTEVYDAPGEYTCRTKASESPSCASRSFARRGESVRGKRAQPAGPRPYVRDRKASSQRSQR